MYNFNDLKQVETAARLAAYRYHRMAKAAETAGRYSDAEYFERLANKCVQEAQEAQARQIADNWLNNL